jgi:hypothetical protein
MIFSAPVRYNQFEKELTARINVFTSRVISYGSPTSIDTTCMKAARWKLSVFLLKIDFW